MKKNLTVIPLILLIVCGFTNCFASLNMETVVLHSIKMINTLSEPREGCIHLYSNCDFQGDSRELCHSTNNLQSIHFHSRINSIIIGKNTKIMIFKEAQFKGNKMKIQTNIRCFERINSSFRNSINSILIV